MALVINSWSICLGSGLGDAIREQKDRVWEKAREHRGTEEQNTQKVNHALSLFQNKGINKWKKSKALKVSLRYST